jgi:peptide/nickel transport system permease protein
VTAYLLQRASQALVVLFGMSLLAFLLIHITPGDPAQISLGINARPEAIETVRTRLGLNEPLPQQYVDFVIGAAHLDFGESLTRQEPVTDLVVPRLGTTLALAGYGSLISLAIGLPLGVLSAAYRNRFADHTTRAVTMIVFAMPQFWLALVLILVFSVNLGIFPPAGLGTGLGQYVQGLTLPALTLALGVAPLIVRTLRSSMVDALQSEYVEAARARGLSRRRVLFRHALRPSLLASVTVVGVNFGYILGASVVVESVFVLPGLGSLLVDAVGARDFPVVQGVTLAFGVVVLAVNLLTDVTYALIDPRVRL